MVLLDGLVQGGAVRLSGLPMGHAGHGHWPQWQHQGAQGRRLRGSALEPAARCLLEQERRRRRRRLGLGRVLLPGALGPGRASEHAPGPRPDPTSASSGAGTGVAVDDRSVFGKTKTALTFSAGSWRCIGDMLAVAEVKAMLASVVGVRRCVSIARGLLSPSQHNTP